MVPLQIGYPSVPGVRSDHGTLHVSLCQLTDRLSALEGAFVLLLEDDAIIAMDTEDMLLGLGAGRVLAAHSLAKAEEHLETGTIDVAVLDIMIGREHCGSLAQRLAARSVPLVLASGFASFETLPEEFRSVPSVQKPYSGADLHAALLKALDGRRRAGN